ncbi:hypothetical protein KR222_006180 [Zaprionus bogoriensis]|nr:hypothetical protein KR222_006180 [Zaprionus bogoriensis]
MKSTIQRFIGAGSGLLLSALSMHALKIANNDDDPRTAHVMDTTAVHNDSDDIYNMGSEQINAALQEILSVEKHLEVLSCGLNDLFDPNCALGSESLNRMLEEILTPKENGSLPYIEPALQL